MEFGGGVDGWLGSGGIEMAGGSAAEEVVVEFGGIELLVRFGF